MKAARYFSWSGRCSPSCLHRTGTNDTRSAQKESLPFKISSIHLSVLLSLEHPLRGLLWFVDELVLAPVHRVQRRPLREVRPLQGDLASMASMASMAAVPGPEVELTDSGQTLTGQGRVQHGVTCHEAGHCHVLSRGS